MGFLGGSAVKNRLPIQEMRISSLDREDSPEKDMATHSKILAWEIPQTQEPGGLQSMGSQKSQTRLGDKATTAINKGKAGNSLVVEWLRLRFHCRGLGVDPWSGTKTSQLDGMA